MDNLPVKKVATIVLPGLHGEYKSFDTDSLQKMRMFFLPPFLINLALIFSSSSLCRAIDMNVLDGRPSPLPIWLFFIIATILSPTIIAFTKLLPDPSHILFSGSITTTIGLLWTGLISGPFQIATLCFVTSFGICMSLIASCICLAPIFVSQNRCLSLFILATSSALMMMQHSLILYLLYALEKHIFLVLSLAVLITSVIPAIFLVKRSSFNNSVEDDENCLVCSNEEEDHFALLEKGEVTKQCEVVKIMKNSTFSAGWLESVLAVAVWIIWGIGVDTTWLPLLVLPGVDSSWLSIDWLTQSNLKLNIIILQICLSIFLCMAKLSTWLGYAEIYSTSPERRLLFSSNYMHLGLLGMAGLLFFLLPEMMDAIHNQMLFAFTFALQFDDLSDLDQTRKSLNNVLTSNCHHSSNTKKFQRSNLKKVLLDGLSLVCHLMSLLLMSTMSIFLGLQFSNLAGSVVKSFQALQLFTPKGLCVVSIISIGVCLVQPDRWQRKSQ